ncbi:unnamed protein product [Psylliodes chrysocephalus]|uniref:Uncharacterized protein n=1 Tax=Psylliodes chrysocephalus TaxID=3402493 RepID=A0A9P0GFA4_9CUCU|nr:unnamed protein product [Psylliodes chrysocephala]
MELDITDNSSTVQGRDTPVPVRVEGGEAGPRGPSSSDCDFLSVTAQAEKKIITTEQNEDEDAVFKRRDSLPRTPTKETSTEWDPFDRRDSLKRTPPRTRSNSLTGQIDPHVNVGQSKKEPTGTDKKRRRMETPEKTNETYQKEIRKMEREYVLFKELLRKIVEEAKTLKTAVTEIPNTKKEIKTAARKLDYHAKEMQTSTAFIDEMFFTLEVNGPIPDISVKTTTDMSAQTEEAYKPAQENSARKTVDASTQTYSKAQEDKEIAIQEIEAKLNRELDRDELNTLIETKWPDEIYKRCKAAIDTETSKEKRDIIIILKEGEEQERRLLQKPIESNPQLATMLEERQLKTGKMVCSKTSSVLITDDHESNNNMDRYTYLIMTESGGETNEDRDNLTENIKKAMRALKKVNRNTVICTMDKQVNEIRTRKLLEYICRKEDMDLSLYMSRTRRRQSTFYGQEDKQTRRNKDIETIIIKPTEGSTYADIMRNMKKDVNTEGILIDRVDKSEEGNIHIKIKGQEEKNRHAFKEQLTQKLSNMAKVETKQINQTVRILDINDTIQMEEAQELIKKEIENIGGQHDGMQIRMAGKSNIRGLKYAFLSVGTDTAQKLLSRRKIGEGWNRWTVKEVENVQKCYNCYRVGHIATRPRVADWGTLLIFYMGGTDEIK